MLQIKDLAFSTSASELELMVVIGGIDGSEWLAKVNKAKPREDKGGRTVLELTPTSPMRVPKRCPICVICP